MTSPVWLPNTARVVPQAEDLYRRLVTDPDLMTQLLALGFPEREARLGLRACQGNVNQAAMHISNRRQVGKELQELLLLLLSVLSFLLPLLTFVFWVHLFDVYYIPVCVCVCVCVRVPLRSVMR